MPGWIVSSEEWSAGREVKAAGEEEAQGTGTERQRKTQRVRDRRVVGQMSGPVIAMGHEGEPPDENLVTAGRVFPPRSPSQPPVWSLVTLSIQSAELLKQTPALWCVNFAVNTVD